MFKVFLESSTIHGLAYIAGTEKLIRLFWIFVVCAGFSGAGILIHQSFQSWAENPIVTSIETLPIEKVRFPKVTVCPPKNTYTNLNNDLTDAGKREISFQEKETLLANFKSHFQNLDYEKTWTEMNGYFEQNKYKNWYFGKSRPPNMTDNLYNIINVKTCVESGVFSTPFFEQDFNESLFIKKMSFSIEIWNPYVDNAITGEAMNIQVSYDFEESYQEFIGFDGESSLDSEKKNEQRVLNNFEWRSVGFNRYWDKLRYLNWENKRFTGMRVTWSYNASSMTKEEKTLKSFLGDDLTKLFIRIANLVHAKENEEAIWNAVKRNKMIKLDEFLAWGYNMTLFYDMMDKIETEMNSTADQDPVQNISDEHLELAARCFTYMFAPHQNFWAKWYSMYSSYLYYATLERTTVRNVVASIAGITDNNDMDLTQLATVKPFILNDLREMINLTTSRDLDCITKSGPQYTSSGINSSLMSSEYLHQISNHPVHLVDNKGRDIYRI